MIGEICVKPVVTTSSQTTVGEAARLMRQKNVGALVVVNASGRPKGMLTDRDLVVDVLANGRDPATVRVGEVMRKDPAVIREDRGILDATKMLSKKAVRRLPVVSKQGKLIGIVALDDLLMLLGSEMGYVASALSRELGRRKM